MHSSRIDTGNETAASMRSMKTEIFFSAVATETKINVGVRIWVDGWIGFTVVSYILSVRASQHHVAYLKHTQ